MHPVYLFTGRRCPHRVRLFFSPSVQFRIGAGKDYEVENKQKYLRVELLKEQGSDSEAY